MVPAQVRCEAAHLRVGASGQPDPFAELCQSRTSSLDGIAVTINPEHLRCRCQLQYALRVTAAADCPVDKTSLLLVKQKVQHFLGHDRLM